MGTEFCQEKAMATHSSVLGLETFILLWGMVLIQPEQELKSPQVQ